MYLPDGGWLMPFYRTGDGHRAFTRLHRDLCQDDRLQRVTPLSETVFLKLLLWTDNLGFTRADANTVKARCLAGRTASKRTVEEAIQALHDAGLLFAYDTDAGKVALIPAVLKMNPLSGNSRASTDFPLPDPDRFAAWVNATGCDPEEALAVSDRLASSGTGPSLPNYVSPSMRSDAFERVGNAFKRIPMRLNGRGLPDPEVERENAPPEGCVSPGMRLNASMTDSTDMDVYKSRSCRSDGRKEEVPYEEQGRAGSDPPPADDRIKTVSDDFTHRTGSNVGTRGWDAIRRRLGQGWTVAFLLEAQADILGRAKQTPNWWTYVDKSLDEWAVKHPHGLDAGAAPPPTREQREAQVRAAEREAQKEREAREAKAAALASAQTMLDVLKDAEPDQYRSLETKAREEAHRLIPKGKDGTNAFERVVAERLLALVQAPQGPGS